MTKVSGLREIVLLLTLGMGIGLLVPYLTFHYSDREDDFGPNRLGEVLTMVEVLEVPANTPFRARIEKGSLAIVDGEEEVILSGIHIENWPQHRQEEILATEFATLDDAQSFIDGVSEELLRDEEQ